MTTNTSGRVVAAVLVHSGICILAVATASIKAMPIKIARRCIRDLPYPKPPDDRLSSRLERIDARLDSID